MKKKILGIVSVIFIMVFVLAMTVSAIDDYPAKWKEPNRRALYDDWGIPNRECVSWVLWCLRTRNGYELDTYKSTKHWGAINWADNAREMGVKVDNTPAVGSIAHWDWTHVIGPRWGHVAWVSEVNGDYVTIEEYNAIPLGGGAYSEPTIHKSEVDFFIHFKDIKDSGTYYKESATQTTTSVVINSEKIEFPTYKIIGDTYFNIRDIAYTLRKTSKKFNVVWKSENKSLYLETGHSYGTVGGEMQSKGAGEKDANPIRNKIYVLGIDTKFTVYEIDGSFYFKLDELGKELNLDLTYNSAGKMYEIDTGDAIPLSSPVLINDHMRTV